MMNFKFSPTLILPLTALAAMLLGTAGCQDDFLSRELPEPPVPPVVVESDPSEGIAVTIPYVADFQVTPTAATRAALGVDDESAIDHQRSRLFLFTKEGTLHHEAPITKVTRDDQDKQKGTITALMKPGKELTAVLVTNLNETAMKQKVAEGTKKDALQALFTFASQQDWTADPASNHLPMWGEVGGVVIDHDAAAVPRVGTIHLLRAVARIDVGLMMSASKQYDKDGDFDETSGELTGEYPALLPDGTKTQVTWALKKVYLYNTSASGLVIPASGNVQSEANGTKKATGVSLPADVAKIDAKGYDFTGDIVSNLLKRSIYVPETDNDPAAAGDKVPGEEYKTRPYLIVGLAYTPKEGDNKKESAITYFRIDFLKHDPEASKPDASTELEQDANVKYDYLPLLRNHRYKVDIRGVGGPGFPTIDEAKEGPAANIMYDVQVWDESELDEVVYDGQYMLGVSAKQVETYKSGGDMTLTVQTSWPKGFHVEGLPEGYTVKAADSDKSTPDYPTTDETKLVIAPPTGEWKPAEKDLKTDEKGNKYQDYTITIRAGRMTWPVTIRRYNKEELRIELFSDPECTQPLQFLSIHELGDAMLPPAQAGGKRTTDDFTAEAFANTKYYGKNDSLIHRYASAPVPVKMPQQGWFDMKVATAKALEENKQLLPNAVEEQVDFTAENSGAVRKFYAKVIAPKGATVEVRPADGASADGSRFTVVRISKEGTTPMAFAVTADECIDEADLFEHFNEEWSLTIRSGQDTSEARLQLYQGELDAGVFSDRTWTMHLFQGEPAFMMNGQNEQLVMRSNTQWAAKITRQGHTGINPSLPQESAKPVQKINATETTSAVAGSANQSGAPFNLTILDDLKQEADKRLYVAYGYLRLAVRERYYEYKSRERRMDFYSGKLLKETQVANSYLMEADGMPLLIPFEKWVNDAAEEYNSRVQRPGTAGMPWFSWSDFLSQNELLSIEKNDKVTAELLWTDGYHDGAPSGKPVGNASDAVVRFLHVFSSSQYGKLLLVIPGPRQGNSLVALRSSLHDPKIAYTPSEPYYRNDGNNHAILWSFHFIVYPKGKKNTSKILTHPFVRVQKKTENTDQGGRADDGDLDSDETYTMISKEHTVRFLRHSLGALHDAPKNEEEPWKTPTNEQVKELSRLWSIKAYVNTDYEAQGMGYQWGRKDPCPLSYQHDIITKFYNGDGVEVKFDLMTETRFKQAGVTDKSTVSRSNRMSVRESIERPMTFKADQRIWMLEGGSDYRTSLENENIAWQVTSIWGGYGATNDSNERMKMTSETAKTHFDPSPYGFAVPTSGYNSSYHMQGTSTALGYKYNVPLFLWNKVTTDTKRYPYNRTVIGVQVSIAAANAYETHEYPLIGYDQTVGGTVHNKERDGVSGRGSLIQIRPVLLKKTLSDWKAAQAIPIGADVQIGENYSLPGNDAQPGIVPMNPQYGFLDQWY